MNQQNDNISYSGIFYRLTALWVVCEAFAGGIMHGIKIPFSGMLVSGLAVICITLIAYNVPVKGAILKATIIVAIFKLMLSPHSPPTAYIAVFFQGLLGQILFSNKKRFTVSAIALGILSLVESAIQRILVLIILYGSNFWKAVNEFLQKVLHEKTLNNYSALLAGGYILIHAVVGILIGFYAARTAKKASGWKLTYSQFIFPEQAEPIVLAPRRKRRKIVFIILFVFLAGLYIQSFVSPAHSILPKGDIAQIILRAALITLCWYLIVAPLIMRAIKYFLAKQTAKNQQSINFVSALLPQTKNIFVQSWQYSAVQPGVGRLKLFFKILLINIIAENKAG